MHRALAVWLSDHPWQAAAITAVLALLSLQGAVWFEVLASAVPVLLLLDRGVVAGLNAALVGSAAVITTLLWFQQPWWLPVAYVVGLFVGPLLQAILLRRFGSLNLVYQVSLALALLILATIFLIVPEPTAVWERLLRQALSTLQEAGLSLDDGLAVQLARTMWGALAAMLLLANLCALWLARWWQSLQHAPGEFGREFRQLRSGNALGVVLLTIVATSWVADFAWLDSMAWIAVLGLAIQGLAAVHRGKAAGQLPNGWLVTIYVMLVVPLFTFLTVLLLAVWGLKDFLWRRNSAAHG